MLREGLEKVELQRKPDGRAVFPWYDPYYDSSMDQQHRATFCAWKDARISYKPAIFMDSGFLVGTYSDILGEENWTLARGDGGVRGRGSNGSTIMLYYVGGGVGEGTASEKTSHFY